jgi:hypothetical protein
MDKATSFNGSQNLKYIWHNSIPIHFLWQVIMQRATTAHFTNQNLQI